LPCPFVFKATRTFAARGQPVVAARCAVLEAQMTLLQAVPEGLTLRSELGQRNGEIGVFQNGTPQSRPSNKVEWVCIMPP
jgi:hypothetical protein